MRRPILMGCGQRFFPESTAALVVSFEVPSRPLRAVGNSRLHQVRIAISVAAYEAIARTLSLGSFGFKRDPNTKGERTVWLEEVWVDRLGAMRGAGESYSDVILRIAAQKWDDDAADKVPPRAS
jgi:hypothetical protein